MTSAPPILTVPFGHLRVAYDERVLTPRAWTEQQSRWAADLLVSAPDGPVLELCAGVGHIGLLALDLAERQGAPVRPLVAVERSTAACAHLRRNAEAAGRAVDVRRADLSDALAGDERFALVIADPPWVLSDRVGDHPADPRGAVDGGEDGLDVARTCVAVGARHLLPGGTLLLQLGTRDQVARLAAECPVEVVEVRDGARGVLALLLPRSAALEGDDVVDGREAGPPGPAGEPFGRTR